MKYIKVPPEKNKDISHKNEKYKFIVGSRELKAFGKGGKFVGSAVGALGWGLSSAANGASGPFLFGEIAIGAISGLFGVNTLSKICDDLDAVHVCLLLGDDIFEYGDEGYARHKNVGKTPEFDWNRNFDIIGETKINPDELEEKIIKSNEWIKDKYDANTHNSHNFVKFCCDILEPDKTRISVVLVNTPQYRLFKVW